MDAAAASKTAHPLSLERLTAAFAQMMGGERDGESASERRAHTSEVSPRAIVEAILFVGADGGRPRTAEQLASVMRDVTPDEVHAAVEALNADYRRDAAPYEIASGAEGYRLRLRDDLSRMRDKFYGRVKQARLSPAALEALALVAYRQPITAASIDAARGARSSTILAQLVRRGLVAREPGAATGDASRYRTTDRFLRLFRLDALDQLPRTAELED